MAKGKKSFKLSSSLEEPFGFTSNKILPEDVHGAIDPKNNRANMEIYLRTIAIVKSYRRVRRRESEVER